MINRARAMVTGLAALAALVLVVAGLPVVLYRFGGSPLPGQIGRMAPDRDGSHQS